MSGCFCVLCLGFGHAWLLEELSRVLHRNAAVLFGRRRVEKPLQNTDLQPVDNWMFAIHLVLKRLKWMRGFYNWGSDFCDTNYIVAITVHYEELSIRIGFFLYSNLKCFIKIGVVFGLTSEWLVSSCEVKLWEWNGGMNEWISDKAFTSCEK